MPGQDHGDTWDLIVAATTQWNDTVSLGMSTVCISAWCDVLAQTQDPVFIMRLFVAHEWFRPVIAELMVRLVDATAQAESMHLDMIETKEVVKYYARDVTEAGHTIVDLQSEVSKLTQLLFDESVEMPKRRQYDEVVKEEAIIFI